jgi:hypothetical protein
LALPPNMDVVDAVRELEHYRRTLRREWLPSAAPVQTRFESLSKLPALTTAQLNAVARTPHGCFERLLHDCGLINIAWYMRHSKRRREWVKKLFRRARKSIANESLRFPAVTMPVTPGTPSPHRGKLDMPERASRAVVLADDAATCDSSVGPPDPATASSSEITDETRERREQLWRDYRRCHAGATVDTVAEDLGIDGRTFRAWKRNERRRDGTPKVARPTSNQIERYLRKDLPHTDPSSR